MPPRRSHRKSRNGCRQCKIRRVKCNEAGPPCGNCIAREITCTYPQINQLDDEAGARSRWPDNDHATFDLSATMPVELSAIQSSDSKHIRELQLMHHYTLHTSLTFCNNTGPDEGRQNRERFLFQQFLPQQSLQCPFVMHAMFAVTAVHCARMYDGKQATDYLSMAMEYQQSSHTMFREAFEDLNQENCHLILAASFAYLILSIATPDSQLEGLFQPSVKDRILCTLRLMRGPFDIYRAYRSTLASTPFAAILEPKDMTAFAELGDDYKMAFDRLREINRENAETANRSSGTASGHLIDELEFSARRSQDGVPMAGLSWLTLLPDKFVSAVEHGEVLPCLMLTHLGVILDRSTAVWWSMRSGKVLVAEMSSTFPKLNDQELEALIWCRQKVGLTPH